jgi:tripartite-type tricarboxylate transporter receptor subunit TctC
MKKILLSWILFWAAAAFAQQYPAKPVRMVVPFPAGGPADIVARQLGVKLTEEWGQALVIENRPGAAGNIGTAYVARATPDGYTILLATSGFMCNPSLYKNVGYDPFKDFAPITNAGISATVVVRHPDLAGVNSMKDLEQLARTSKVDFSTPGIGLAGHLAGELFKTLAKVDMQAIPFAGGGPAMTAVLSGQVKVGFMAIPASVPHIKSGRLVAIGVTSPQRLPLLPEVPTVAEQGYPGFQVDNMYGILAPAGTPPEIVTRLNTELRKIIDSPDIKKMLGRVGFEAFSSSPQEMQDTIKLQLGKWGKMVKDAGIHPE